MNCVTNEHLLASQENPSSYMGQVMNKVQTTRRLSRTGSNPAISKNKAKAAVPIKPQSFYHQKYTRFQRLKFTIKTFHYLITTITLVIPVWIFCIISRLFNFGEWNKIYSEYSVAIIGSRSPLSIQLARHFRRMGYTVIGMESRRYMCAPLAWSRACDKFYWLPDPLEPPIGSGPEVYTEALWGIMLDTKPNLLIPLNRFTSAEDQQVIEKTQDMVDLLSMGPLETIKLTDVNTFYKLASDSNCKTPEFKLITDKRGIQLKGFNFDNHPWMYRAYSPDVWGGKLIKTPSTSREVSELVQQITTTTPVLLIEKFEDPVISISSLYANRIAIAHSLSKRENDLISSVTDRKLSQSITEWSQIFVERYNVDIEGWLSFDFMKSQEDGKWYPINCKPWITEPFSLLHGDSVDIVESIELTTRGREESDPLHCAPDTYIRCSAQDLITAFRKPYKLTQLLRFLAHLRHQDIVFLRSDPFPFFAMYFLDLPMQLWLFWRTGRLWQSIDYFNNSIIS